MATGGPAKDSLGAPETVTATVQMAGPDWQLRATMYVPAGPIRLSELLPLAHSFADAMAGSAVKEAEARGEKISCKDGCGACCSQLVPLAEAEARRLSALLERLPEPRRRNVRARFAAANRRLEAAGLLGRLQHADRWSDGEGRSIGLAYLRQGIPCPLLEEASCSIYADRPVACREYLVTSPAENCIRPTGETVACVKLPLKVWTAMARFDEVPPTSRFIRWVPLILAPAWAEAHPDEPLPRPGPEMLREFFDHLTGKRLSRTEPARSPFDEVPVAVSPSEEARR